MILCICQSTFEPLLAEELRADGQAVGDQGPGWLVSEAPLSENWAFPQGILDQPIVVEGESVNALANAIATYFMEGLRGERIEANWPCVFAGPAEIVGLGRRISAVEGAFHEALKKRLNRVAKLAVSHVPKGVGRCRGLFVYFTDFKKAYVSRDLFHNGQRRMADDDLAPSRSYLKVEEAYGILGHEPQVGDQVCDLGAAPGGWSYSAAKRGARVVAIDNGPLKGGALDNPAIEHRMEDAFRYEPVKGAYDWLFCDMIEDPHHIMRAIVHPWLESGACRYFVINLKFGRVKPIELLEELKSPSSPFFQRAPGFRVRHLTHDREEFTVVGEVNR